MEIFDIATDVENQMAKLTSARAVLKEVIWDTEIIIEPGTEEAGLFVRNREQMNLLLGVHYDILSDLMKGLEQIVDNLYSIAS